MHNQTQDLRKMMPESKGMELQSRKTSVDQGTSSSRPCSGERNNSKIMVDSSIASVYQRRNNVRKVTTTNRQRVRINQAQEASSKVKRMGL